MTSYYLVEKIDYRLGGMYNNNKMNGTTTRKNIWNMRNLFDPVDSRTRMMMRTRTIVTTTMKINVIHWTFYLFIEPIKLKARRWSRIFVIDFKFSQPTVSSKAFVLLLLKFIPNMIPKHHFNSCVFYVLKFFFFVQYKIIWIFKSIYHYFAIEFLIFKQFQTLLLFGI